MGKLPYFEFYPSDWANDTSMLPLKIKGAWIDILCGMWWNGSRGELTGSWEDFSRYLRVDVDETKYCIQCLITYKICDVNTLPNGNLTLISRRIKKDEKNRINNKLRQRIKYHKDREKQEPHALQQEPHISFPSSSSSSYKDKENIYSIFSFWNEQQIIVHRETKTSLAECINARLEKYKVDEIKEAIKNYKTILFSKDYYWTHKWTLKQFLQRGLDLFSTSNNPFDNYRKKSKERSGVIDITKTTEEIK